MSLYLDNLLVRQLHKDITHEVLTYKHSKWEKKSLPSNNVYLSEVKK